MLPFHVGFIFSNSWRTWWSLRKSDGYQYEDTAEFRRGDIERGGEEDRESCKTPSLKRALTRIEWAKRVVSVTRRVQDPESLALSADAKRIYGKIGN
ncbi:hypothetical protein N7513_007751 [Penicillium frequentans]|nr:hypothetical protein N7513_007751 [Penicillium glabrum]